jgi:hypothetical protein
MFNKRLKEKYELYTIGRTILNILVHNSNMNDFDRINEKFKMNNDGDNFYIISKFRKELQDIYEILIDIL